MAFWDELKEKITQGGQEALQKTRDIAEVVTTNANISESKKKINELYTELGQMLVKKAFENMTSSDIAVILEDETADDASHVIVLDNWRDFYNIARFIRSEEEVIALSEKKISDLRAEAKCPSCGSRIPKGAMFCPECGAKLSPDNPAEEGKADPVQPEPVKEQQQPAEEQPQPEPVKETPAPDNSASAADAGQSDFMDGIPSEEE